MNSASSQAYIYRVLSLCNDFLLVVRTTILANSVREHKLAALRALYKIKSRHLPVSSSLISVSLRRFILRTN